MGKHQLLFVTDVHGSEVCFRKFLNSWKIYEVKSLILGGDVTGKMVVPVVEKDGTYHAKIYGTPYEAKNPEEFEKMKRKIRDMSGYPFVTTEEEKIAIDADPKRVEELFKKLSIEALEGWLELAEQRLKGTGIKLYVTGGNDDPTDIGAVVRKHESDIVTFAEEKVLTLPSGHEMIGLGYSNPTPWHLPRDTTEEELEKKIDKMAGQVSKMKTAIFNLHVPPYNTPPLDFAPKLDANMKPQLDAGGQFKMVPVGSTSVRKALERYQPLLGLHGHIHESKGAVYINKTLAINPGSEYGEGILKGVIVELNDDKKPSYVFTSG